MKKNNEVWKLTDKNAFSRESFRFEVAVMESSITFYPPKIECEKRYRGNASQIGIYRGPARTSILLQSFGEMEFSNLLL